MSQPLSHDPLNGFHPILAAWFRRSLGEPTPVQAQAWKAIREGGHTLIAAPTGSGKTLAAFFTILNDLVARDCEGDLPPETTVLYVSPLKALSNDVEKNLSRPLREIADDIFQAHLRKVNIKVAVRTGDTPASERAAMVKANPHILITTPESLYLLLTSRRGREMLGRVRTVIIDEIHALVGEKRGSHLSLSLERLEALCGRPLARIGLSATQSPITEVARFLTGTGGASGGEAFPPCTIIDAGHRRRLDLGVEIPESPLSAVMAGEVWDEVYARIEALIAEHRTTLVFVNTRRLAERVAHRLSESLGEDKIAAHHGSLSRDRRFDAEQRLKSGSLKALVATASLELGIDIGSVDLVIQIACPKSISAFLQRVGRSGHAVGATPKGRLFPLTRDELCEAAALLDAVRRGELDTLSIPAKPLDILAQQIVAEVACREWRGEDLHRMFSRAYPYRDLAADEFREIADMVSQGFSSRRGRRGAYLHQDGINDRLRGRPGARLAALTNGGAIPDTFDYDVKLEPGNTFLGTVNEDFAIDSMAGDIFQLGNNSWQILRIEASTVRVSDAHGQPPTIPFWFGEAPGRSVAFSEALSRLRGEISTRLGETPVLQGRVEAEGSGPGAPWKRAALEYLTGEAGLGPAAAEQLADYLAAAKLSLGVMPTRDTLVLERFFDEAGDMHLILHSPFGSRMNRAWGLALRKRFCKKFNFELQAAATEDAIILSLGATHSFPLEEVFQYLKSATVRPILVQALLDAPMFEVRWRWNASRSLAILRNRGGKRVPPQLQRMAAEDLVSLVFPDSRACFENIQGEREVPDHPLVRQTIGDCLHEAMDIVGLETLFKSVEAGALRLEARDLKEPSPLAQEIINARPYAFLDDAPLEERRTRAISSRRWIDPAEAGDLGRLDPLAIAAVRAEAWPQARDPDELHDALMLTGFLTEGEIDCGNGGAPGAAVAAGIGAAPVAGIGGESWRALLEQLKADNRAASLAAAAGGGVVWVASERLSQALAALPGAVPGFEPALPPGVRVTGTWSEEEALVEILRGRMESLGPVRAPDLAASLGIPEARVDLALLALEQEGFVLRGKFSPEVPQVSYGNPEASLETLDPRAGPGAEELATPEPAGGQRGLEKNTRGLAPGNFSTLEWCERRLLARIHRYTLARLRKEIEPVSAADYLRFLFAWQGVEGTDSEGMSGRPTGDGAAGPDALEAVLLRVEGFEAPCAAWEKDILPARMAGYDPSWLDLQCLSGRFMWGRVRPGRHPQGVENRKPGPVKATPIAFLARENLDIWLNGPGPDGREAQEPEGDAALVWSHLRNRGASFWHEIVRDTRLPGAQVQDALSELVALGWVTSDGFRGLRSLLHASRGLDRSGRWSLLRTGATHTLPASGESPSPSRGNGPPGLLREDGTEAVARVLLRRYGVVFRKLADRENLIPPWRELVRVFRLLEARGEVRGGRFVEGFYGEQFALPEAVGRLRRIRKQEATQALVSLSAADPANLHGVLTPGPRIPAIRKNRVLFRDGSPIAVLEGGETRSVEGAGTLPREWEKVLRGMPSSPMTPKGFPEFQPAAVLGTG